MSELKWEEGKTYKLVDEEGFLANHEANRDILDTIIDRNNNCAYIYEVCENFASIQEDEEGGYVLFHADIKFFEEVVVCACWEQGKTYKVKHPENLHELFLEGMQGREYITVLGVYPDIGGLHASCDVKGFELTPSCRENFEEVVKGNPEELVGRFTKTQAQEIEDKVVQQLEAARANKQTTAPSNVKMTHHAQMQIGKKGSEEVFEYISAVEVEGKYYLIQYNGSVPDVNHWYYRNLCSNMKVDEATADWLVSDFTASVAYWEDYKHYHLNPYTFLIVQMLNCGHDLVEMGIIEI